MKKFSLFLLFSMILMFINESHATVWRLNNWNGISAHFTGTLQEAVNAVSDGDTIYVEPSPFDYGEVIIAKKVILIGGGYWLSENDSTSAIAEKSKVSKITFDPGSEGSIISSLYLYRWFPYNATLINLIINTDSITLQKNYICGASSENAQAQVILINGNRTGIVIKQNWLESKHPANYNKYLIYINGSPEDILIKNNFLKTVTPNNYAIKATLGSSSMGLRVTNNVIWGIIETYDEMYVNNIMVSGTFYNASGGVIANNICNGEQFPDINNNQLNVNMATVFVDMNLLIDKGYILTTGSPAIAAGFNGGDCGAFSNDFDGNPYVLSGIPNIPTIFDVEFNTTVFPAQFQNLEINIKAKSNN